MFVRHIIIYIFLLLIIFYNLLYLELKIKIKTKSGEISGENRIYAKINNFFYGNI